MKMKNHQPRLREGGLGDALCLELVGQACFPARRLEFVIRMAGMNGDMHKAGQEFVLRPELFMTLNEVEQRSAIPSTTRVVRGGIVGLRTCVEIECGVDHGNVRKGLGEVADHSFGFRVVLFREHAEVVA